MVVDRSAGLLWALCAVVLVPAAAVVTVLALPSPKPSGVVPACEQLADDVGEAGSFGALAAMQPRDWALVVGRYRAVLGRSYDAGVGDVLDAATPAGNRRIALLAGFEWCLTSGWLPGRAA